MCVAPTGSGKTLAYLLPTIVNLRHPARELRIARTSNDAAGKDGEVEDNDILEDSEDLDDLEGGRGIRSVIVVPTHDLAIQIQGVAKAVMAGRSWRVMVLTKATERAICISSPGKKFDAYATASKKKDQEETPKTGAEEEEEANEDDDMDVGDEEDEIMSTGSTDEFAQSDVEVESEDDQEEKRAGSSSLGIDILIATPERLHHLIQSKQISLKQ